MADVPTWVPALIIAIIAAAVAWGTLRGRVAALERRVDTAEKRHDTAEVREQAAEARRAATVDAITAAINGMRAEVAELRGVVTGQLEHLAREVDRIRNRQEKP